MSKRSALIATFALALGAAPAHAADAPPTARAVVGKPVQDAQALVRQKKYADALARLKAADAVPDKTPYETCVIDETRAAAEVGNGDYAAAVTALSAVLATHILTPADSAKRLLTIVELDYRLKDYAKTVAAAQQYYKNGGADPEPRRLMAQSYYLENDYTEAAGTLRAILADDTRAAQKPDEATLLTLASSEYKAKNQEGYVDALLTLVQDYPKHEYWADLARAVEEAPGFAPRLGLDLDRVAIATGAFETSAQYVDAAEMALEAGFPGDAKSFLAKGYADGILGKGADAPREQRLDDMAKRQSDEDVKGLAAEARDAGNAKTGLALEKLGEAYLSYGRFQDAAAALEHGIAKGGLDHADDARLHLGVTYLRAGDAAQAKATLSAIAGQGGIDDLARMWLAAGGK
jgi:hypothetical protein